MSTHPPNSQLADFLERKLPPDQVLSVDRHVARCGACQDVLQSHLFGGSPVPKRVFYDELDGHLTYEELRAAVYRGTVDPRMKEHLHDCPLCEGEYESLKQFAHGLHTIPRQTGRSATPYWYGLIAAMALLSVTGIYFSRVQQRVAPPAERAGIIDGDSRLTLAADGGLRGADSLPLSERALLTSVLSTGRLQLPDALPGTGKRTETMLGAPTQATAAFRVLSPVRAILLPEKPTFRWQNLPGATAYEVTVYDAGYRKVAESSSLTANSWQSETVLERGKSYTWTVMATTGGTTVRVPAPPEAEARFTVMAADAASRLQQAQIAYPGHHVLLTALYAREGDIDDAQQELAKADAANPGDPRIAKLKQSLNQAAQSPSPINTKPAQ